MVVYTARLCGEVAFLPPRETEALAVVCAEVVGAEGVEAMVAGGLGRREAGAGAGEEEARPVVGGIAVGGMRLVGAEGRRLATAAAAAAPVAATTTAATARGEEAGTAEAGLVAKMRPGEEGGRVQTVGDAELVEMGFRPEEVQALLEEMQGVAEGNGWRVELVDVGGGGEGVEGGGGGGGGGGGEEEGEEGSEEGYYRDEL